MNHPGAEAGQGHPVLDAVAGDNLEQGRHRARVVRLEVDAHRHAGESLEHFFEGRYTVAVEVTAVGSRDVPSPDLVETESADPFAHPGQPLAVGIMGHNEVAVVGAVDVKLESVGAVRKRPLEGRKGVLRQQCRSPAMAIQSQLMSGWVHQATIKTRCQTKLGVRN